MARASENKLRLAWTAAIPDHVMALTWSPDGRQIAAAAVNGPVVILDASTGKPIHELKGHGFGTTTAAWQHGGNLLATAGQDARVRLWDTSRGSEVLALDGGAAWVEHLAWNANGTMLAAAAGKFTRVWDPSGTLVCQLPPQAGTITDLAWRPGTNTLTVLAYGAAAIFDPAHSPEPIKRFEWKGSPLKLAWSPDGRMLAHGNQDATVHFWYHDSGVDLQMSGFATKVRELAWDFTSRYLATGGGPVACLWDCGGPQGPEGTRPQMLEGHEENLTALAYQSRGYLLASTASDGYVRLWQPANKKNPNIGQYRFDTSEAVVLAWSPDDKSLAAGSGSGKVAVFRVG